MSEDLIIIDDPWGNEPAESYEEIRRWFEESLVPYDGPSVVILSKLYDNPFLEPAEG